jgi:hypothetical protein
MPRNQMPLLFLGLLFLAALGWLVSNSRAATETPDYKVVRADGKIEIRDYPPLVIATTTMAADGMNGGFGELFRFITGGNEGDEKIAMTSPVLIDTAPERRTMSFIMPRKAAEKGVPKPSGDKVTLGKVDPARFAVLRFGGGRTAENESEAITRLTTWLASHQIAPKGDPMFAYYDPPWTPTFMRRNEVMIRVDAP